MHEYRRYVEREMDARHWTQADLARAAKLDRQVIHAITQDTRDRLPQVPRMKTVEGLARAFNVKPEVVLAHVALAMGLPVSIEQANVADVSDADLLSEIRTRMEARHDRQGDTQQGSEEGSTVDGSEDRRTDGSTTGGRQTPMSELEKRREQRRQDEHDSLNFGTPSKPGDLDQGKLQPPPARNKSAAYEPDEELEGPTEARKSRDRGEEGQGDRGGLG